MRMIDPRDRKEKMERMRRVKMSRATMQRGEGADASLSKSVSI